jgi:hypothetical protein
MKSSGATGILPVQKWVHGVPTSPTLAHRHGVGSLLPLDVVNSAETPQRQKAPDPFHGSTHHPIATERFSARHPIPVATIATSFG